MLKTPEPDLDFLPPRVAAVFRVGHKKTYLAQKMIFLFFAAFMAWAYFAELHEITKGTGRIISSAHIQTLNNLEGGIIKEILVRDDQVVTQGEVLVKLDKTISQAKFLQDLENYYRLLASAERLRVQIANGMSFIPSLDLQRNAPNIIPQEMERFRANQAKKKNDIEIAVKDLAMKQQELDETSAKLKDARQQYQYAKEQAKIIEPLASKKIYSRMDYIKLKRDMVEQKAQVALLQANAKRQEIATKQAKDRLDQVRIRYHNDDLQELREVEAKLTEARGAETADLDRVTRTEIRSPVTGIVRDLKVHTLGSVIQPGEAILDIVPLNDTLIVEAQIAPSDIGFLRPQLPAIIKVTAYDFSSYGGLDAVISEISPDTITDKREQSYYRVLLQTKTNILVKNGKVHPIMPGMQVEVDILTGKKSVLAYLFKPFLRALQNSMTER